VAYLKERLRLKPQGVSALGDFHRSYLEHGNLDPDHAPPMGFAHLTTVAEFRGLFLTVRLFWKLIRRFGSLVFSELTN
jgi:hypothetical protein